MVVKQCQRRQNELGQFESRVILDGSQTQTRRINGGMPFESRVILDGSQTRAPLSGARYHCLRVVLF